MHALFATIFVSFVFAILFQIPSVESFQIGSIFQKIAGGEKAREGEFPYIAALYINIRADFKCGATIITPQHLLTAAHCLKGLSAESIRARVGLTNLSNHKPQRDEFLVHRIITHPGYNDKTKFHDIAILHLRGRMKFDTPTVQPACLPKTSKEYAGLIGTAAGWGNTLTSEHIQNDLRKVDMRLISNEECKKMIKIKDGQKYITDYTLCAGIRAELKGVCKGDSGGPLILKGSKDPIVIGTGSVIVPCQTFAAPQIFTRFSKYVDWIKKETDGEELCLK